MKNLTLERIARVTGGSLHFTCRNGSTMDCEEAMRRLAETEVSAIVTDSRKAGEGCLFAAIPGARVDGHKFIPQVFAQGSVCVIASRPLSEADIFGTEAGGSGADLRAWIQVEETIPALGKIAAEYLKILGIPVVGVTGSVGKTSTKEMIASVLSQKYRTLKTEGNFNNELGLPLTVFRLTEEDEIAVLEMGISHFGEMHGLASIAHPDTAVITNIGTCHLEFLGDRDGVLRAKTEIFDFLRPGAHVILNGNDDKLRTIDMIPVGAGQAEAGVNGAADKADTSANGTAAGKAEAGAEGTAQIAPLWFGVADTETDVSALSAGKQVEFPAAGKLPQERTVYADHLESLGFGGTKAEIHTPAGTFSVRVPVPGIHNVINAAAATAVGLTYGLTLKEIAAGIESMRTIAGRFRILDAKTASGDRFTVIDDCYNASPMSMKTSLAVLRESPGRRIAVLGDMGELGADEVRLHSEVGTAAANSVDLLITIGTLSEHIQQAALEVNPALAARHYETVDDFLAALGCGGTAGTVEERREDFAAESGGNAVTAADSRIEAVAAGDVILVKASHFMNFTKIVNALTAE